MKTELNTVALMVAHEARKLTSELVADPALKSIVTGSDAAKAIDAVVRKDPVPTSKRSWAIGLSVISAILAVPEIQAMLGETWMPVITSLLTAAAVLWSKATDPRPTR